MTETILDSMRVTSTYFVPKFDKTLGEILDNDDLLFYFELKNLDKVLAICENADDVHIALYRSEINFLCNMDEEDFTYLLSFCQTFYNLSVLTVDYTTSRLLAKSPKGMTQFLFKIFEIKTVQDIKKLYNTFYLEYLITNINISFLHFFSNIYKEDTKNKLENFFKNKREILLSLSARVKNLKILADFYNIKTPQEFENFIEDKNFCYIVKHGWHKNIRFLFDFCKNQQEFEKLLFSHEMRDFFCFTDLKNLKKFLNFYKIKDADDLLTNTEDVKVVNFVRFSSLPMLSYAFNLCKTMTNLKIMLKDDHLYRKSDFPSWLSSKCIVDFYKIENSTDFKNLNKNNALSHLMIWAKPRNIKTILELCKNPQEFEDLTNNNNIMNIIKEAKPETLKFVIDFYKIKNINELKKVCSIFEFNLFVRDVRKKDIKHKMHKLPAII